MLRLRTWVRAIVREWPLLVALVVGLAALAVQAAPAPAALAHGGVPLAMARDLASGVGLGGTLGAWPSSAFAPIYPVLLAMVWNLWPVFPDGLVLVAVLDAALLACGAWWFCRLATRTGTKRKAWPILIMVAVVTPMIVVMRDTRASPYPLCFMLGAIAIVLAHQRSNHRAIGSGLVAAGAALAWSGAVPLVVANAVLWWTRAKRDGARASVAGIVPVAIWWTIVVSATGSSWGDLRAPDPLAATVESTEGIAPAVRLDMLAQGIVLGIEQRPRMVSDAPAHLGLRIDQRVLGIGDLCERSATHVGVVFPERQGQWIAEQRARGVTLAPLFQITDGPALFEARCDR